MTMDSLFHGTPLTFSAWPTTGVPKGPPGVYTIWRGDEFLYVGISWREPTATSTGSSKGLWGRLDSHASGRRSGDQFCIYVCDRFVLHTLSTDQLTKIAAAELSLDALTRAYIRSYLSYRFVLTATGNEARQMESDIRRGAWDGRKPWLNPTAGPNER